MGKDNKILPYKDRKKLQSVKKPIVLVGGCFDLFHYGHLRFLSKAKKNNEILVIALESDKHILINKKRPPIHNQIQRAEILAAIKYVDYILLLPLIKSDEGYRKLVNDISPSVIAVTKGDPQLINKTNQAKKINAKVRIATDYIKNYSTQHIINLLN